MNLPLTTYTAPGTCPLCGREGLRKLTWLAYGTEETSLGCWSCDWVTFPPGIEERWNASLTGLTAPTPPVWDGVWDLSDDDELQGLVRGYLSRGFDLALYQIGSDWQCGWRTHKPALRDVWGARLPCPRRALQDVCERLFTALKQGREAIHSHASPEGQPHAVAFDHGMLRLSHESLS